ncbi:MAG: LysR family transcriptional regulator [Hyphomicrobiaceae bacterium]
MSHLRDIAVFARVVELKGFAAAGRALGLTAPSVSKQIARLEAEIGVALLHRTTHNLFLTDAGKAFYEHCVRGLAEIERARAEAMSYNDTMRGTLRVYATMSVGQALVGPSLIEFMCKFPEIRVELETGSVAINPMEHQVDIAIRTKTPRQLTVGHVSVGQRILCPVRQLVVASPAYLKRAGRPETIEDIVNHPTIVYLTQTTSSEQWQFQSGKQETVIKVEPVLRTNNWLTVRGAALRGIGIARLPDFTVRDQIASGELVSMFDDQARCDQQLQALFPKAPRMPAKIRQLLDFFVSDLPARTALPAPAGRPQSTRKPASTEKVR